MMSVLRNCGVSLACLVSAIFVLALPGAAQSRHPALANVKTWAYQLKDVTPDKLEKIAASPFDMVIIDSSMFPGGKEQRLTREQVEGLKKKPDGTRRLVIAYFSAGESEDFRYYWKPEWNRKKPDWVLKADKDWKGDFIVKYWMKDWQKSSTARRKALSTASSTPALTASPLTAWTPTTTSATLKSGATR